MNKSCPFLLGLLLMAVPVAQAQFTYTTNGSTIALTAYTGSGGAVVVSNFVNTIASNSFYDSTNLTSVTIPDSVTSLGYGAFGECWSLTNATLGANIASIGDEAFQDCTNLAGLTLPDTVTNIGYGAFQDCTNFGSFTIPNSVTALGDAAFYECFDLTNVNDSTNASSIGTNAFQDCYALASFTIPPGVTNIGTNAFQDCAVLTNIIVPNTVTTIDDRAFGGCVSLASFTFPNSVTSIGEGSFAWCGLTNITIGNGVTSIGGYAFQYCTSLATATISPSVTTIGDFAFADCLNLTAINVNATNPAFMSAGGVLFNASQTTLIQYPIGNGATSYTIPNGVTSIGDGAFDHCTNLTSITIPNSVTNIGTNAFSCCIGLTNLTIANGVASIGDGAFNFCSNLVSVTVPASVANIGSMAFSYCVSLKAIYFQGNAPSTNGPVFLGDSMTNYAYYIAGTTGWNSTFAGFRTSKTYGVTFSATPTNGVAPLTVNFTSGSTDTGSNTITSWNWAFGDGGTSNVQSPSHTYTIAGTFYPVLFATNSGGTRVLGLSSVAITVSPPPSIGSCGLNGANLVLNGSNGCSGATYYVLMSTDLTLPPKQWTPVATNVVSASGNFTITVTNTVGQNVPQQFYILQSP